MNKWMYALFGLLLLGGFVFAMSGADDVTVNSESRWTGDTPDNDTTEGGNVTDADVNGTVLTDKWADYYGNVTGWLVLGNDTDYVYQWQWNYTGGGGEVCLSTNSAFDFSVAETATAAGIDTAWVFTASDGDSAANTFTDTCDLNFSQASVSGTASVDHSASGSTSTFETCAVDDSGAAETNFAFCTLVDPAGTNYAGAAAAYEIMVPTTEGPTDTETYYFYLELQ